MAVLELQDYEDLLVHQVVVKVAPVHRVLQVLVVIQEKWALREWTDFLAIQAQEDLWELLEDQVLLVVLGQKDHPEIKDKKVKKVQSASLVVWDLEGRLVLKDLKVREGSKAKKDYPLLYVSRCIFVVFIIAIYVS